MLNFSAPMEEIPECQWNCIRIQKLNNITMQDHHNFGNCIISLPLLIPSGLSSTDPSIMVLHPRKMAYAEVWEFIQMTCNRLTMQLIYDHQQWENIELLHALESVPTQ